MFELLPWPLELFSLHLLTVVLTRLSLGVLRSTASRWTHFPIRCTVNKNSYIWVKGDTAQNTAKVEMIFGNTQLLDEFGHCGVWPYFLTGALRISVEQM